MKIRDESIPRSHIVEQILQLSGAPLTARDLIAERVRAEQDRQTGDAPLVDRDAPRNAGLGSDVDTQIDVALAAFEGNGFVLLVDNVQVDTLDQPLRLTSDSVVTFLRLTPLKGG
ncbi:MAG: hypothetical protein QNJ09_05350 [Paracoccaceae bacterium]|nr:hypothetical protein [Paracoccaceae bacterium]